MGKRENKVEKYLSSEIKKLGGITRKWAYSNTVGIPDQIVILGGWICFVEVKTTDGALTTVQLREHEKLQTYGAIVFTVYGHKGVDKWIHWVKTNKAKYISQDPFLRQNHVDTF